MERVFCVFVVQSDAYSNSERLVSVHRTMEGAKLSEAEQVSNHRHSPNTYVMILPKELKS